MRMCLISARARVHVLVVVSRTKRVSITADGPQEMFGPHAGPVGSLPFPHVLPLRLFAAVRCARAHERWGVAGANSVVTSGGFLRTSVMRLTRAQIKSTLCLLSTRFPTVTL